MYSAVKEHFCETAWVESFIPDSKNTHFPF